jgi:serine/threonine-protein kinase
MDVKLASEPLYAELGPAFDLSPDGTRVAFVTGGDTDRDLRVRRLDQLDSTTFVSTTTADQGPYHPFFSPDGAWVGYVTPTELRKVPVAGGTPLTVAKVNRSRGATWTLDGSIIVAPTPNTGLHRVSATGGDLQPITTLDPARQEGSHRWPQALPDGNAVLFTTSSSPTSGFDDASLEVLELATGKRTVVLKGGSFGRYVPTGHLLYVNRGTLFAAPFDLGTRAVTGTAAPVVQNVTSSASEGSAQVSFSANGRLIYLRGGPLLPQYPIVWVDRQGQVTPLLAEPGTYASPRLSPDGRRLSLTVLRDGNWDVWVYDLERHVMTRLTFDEGSDTEQIWSPDGRELLFGSDRGNRRTALYRKPSDGSGEERLVAQTDADLWPTTWSPDGRVAGVSGNRQSYDVGLVSLADKPAFEWVAATPFSETDPAFSPDGRWLAYSSTESGTQQIYVRPYPSGTGRWQISDSGGGYARWARSGRELFYRSDTGVMAAAIEPAGESLRTGKPRLLFAGPFRGGIGGLGIASNSFPDYDVSPDGQRFVMFPEAASTGGERLGLVTIVSNWFQDLDRAFTAGAR